MQETVKNRALVSGRLFRTRTSTLALNILFFILLTIGLLAFVFYLLRYQNLLVLYFPTLLQGTLVTLIISVVSMILATIFGFIGALGRLSRFAWIRWIATAYVEVIRGTPVLVQLSFWYFGLGIFLSSIGFNPYVVAFNIMTTLQSNSLVPDGFNGFFYGVLGLSFNYGAYLTEVFRTGIESIDRGQSEAALSLGLNSAQTMRYVILPQAIRITIPPFTNYFITLIQDSSLLAVFSVTELQQLTYGLAFPQVDANKKLYVFIFGSLFYLIVCYPLSLFARSMERRLSTAY